LGEEERWAAAQLANEELNPPQKMVMMVDEFFHPSWANQSIKSAGFLDHIYIPLPFQVGTFASMIFYPPCMDIVVVEERLWKLQEGCGSAD